MPLVGAWVGFGLFTIGCSTLVALHADRLAHRRHQVVLTMFFEHVLQLPLSYYTGTHSGRLMKVMLTGTDSLWALWLSFFREHFSRFVSLLVLLPLSLFLNWRLGAAADRAVRRLRGAHRLGRHRRRDAAALGREHTTPTWPSAPRRARQHRAGAELRPRRGRSSGMKKMGDDVLGAQMPVLSWWAVVAVITRAATTITMLAIFLVGICLYIRGETTSARSSRS